MVIPVPYCSIAQNLLIGIKIIRLLMKLFLCFTDGLSVQSFKDEPSYTEVNPGETAELRCVINSIGGSCGWQKDGLVSHTFLTREVASNQILTGPKNRK